MVIRSFAVALAWSFVLAPVAVLAQKPANWTEWRGESRSGTLTGVPAPKVWPPMLTKQWRSEVGLGYSTPLVVDGCVYAFGRQGEEEVMSALDALTGAVIWRTAYPAPFKLPDGTGKHGLGPKSTPAYAEGRLFALGITGIFSAYDARTGELLWQKPAPSAQPKYGTSVSPLTETGVVIVHLGGHDNGALTAFDVTTGAVKWEWTGDGPGYASPQFVQLGGMRQLVVLSQENLVGLAPATGALLWKQPFKNTYYTNIVTPVVYNDLVLVSANISGTVAYKVAKKQARWTVTEAWKKVDVQMNLSNPILRGTTLIGMSAKSAGQFFAMDIITGQVAWKSRGREGDNASIADIGNALLVLKDSAELLVARPTASGLDVLETYTVADSATYGQPAIVGNRIFVKDHDGLSVWSF
jgi:outer membrane protein assembly factor BamB